jgi:hypothetical protein
MHYYATSRHFQTYSFFTRIVLFLVCVCVCVCRRTGHTQLVRASLLQVLQNLLAIFWKHSDYLCVWSSRVCGGKWGAEERWSMGAWRVAAEGSWWSSATRSASCLCTDACLCCTGTYSNTTGATTATVCVTCGAGESRMPQARHVMPAYPIICIFFLLIFSSYTQAHTYMYVYTCIYICIHISSITHTHTHTYIFYLSIYMFYAFLFYSCVIYNSYILFIICLWSVDRYVYRYRYRFMLHCSCMFSHTQINMCVCVCVCVYVCVCFMLSHTHTYAHAFLIYNII